jgi:hypothetical protein
VAHRVTNSRERVRKSHISKFSGLCAVRTAGRGDSAGMGGASGDVAGGLLGSAVTTYSTNWPKRGRAIQTHLGILRPEGLDPLGHIPVVDVAAIDFEEIAEGRRIVARTLQCGGKFVMESRTGFLIQAGEL